MNSGHAYSTAHAPDAEVTGMFLTMELKELAARIEKNPRAYLCCADEIKEAAAAFSRAARLLEARLS